MNAKESVLITDWWFTPQLYLLRPPTQNEHSRLDRVIKTISEKGVRVHIIVYREIEGTLYVDSYYVKDWMEKLNNNI